MMRTLENRIAVVTGGTRGVGRGIASELASRGAQVFVTGRSIKEGPHDDPNIFGIRCDHRHDQEVVDAFERVTSVASPKYVNKVW
jgi:dehydrogenase/reductase SDR family member 1